MSDPRKIRCGSNPRSEFISKLERRLVVGGDPLAIAAVHNVPPPPFVLQVPRERGTKTFLQTELSLIAKLADDFFAIDRIPPIVSGTVPHETYQLTRTFILRRGALRVLELELGLLCKSVIGDVTQQVNEVNVLVLTAAADVVHLTGCAF